MKENIRLKHIYDTACINVHRLTQEVQRADHSLREETDQAERNLNVQVLKSKSETRKIENLQKELAKTQDILIELRKEHTNLTTSHAALSGRANVAEDRNKTDEKRIMELNAEVERLRSEVEISKRDGKYSIKRRESVQSRIWKAL